MLAPLGTSDRNVFAGLRPLRENESLRDRTMQRLASGRAVNSAAENPAGLIAGLHLDAAIRALDAESRTLQREAGRLATQDGALSAAGDMVSELRALAVQAGNSGAMSDAERQALEVEGASIVRAIEHTAGGATFGGEKLFESALTTDTGAVQVDDGSGQQKTYTLADVGRGLSLTANPGLIAQIADQAVSDIATMRGEIGAAIANDIEPRARAIDTEVVNLAQAHSDIVDADYARETATLARAQALGQASRYLLALDQRNAHSAAALLAGAA
ncbi:MAG: flagellin [Phycisphaerales bacterium]|nr:flagellin [Phycisphaerales bacterium]